MASLPLLRAEDTALLVIDMQERLAAAMPAGAWTTARESTMRLARAASLLDLPVIVTRQYPDGLGDTDSGVAEALPDHAVTLDKTAFSASGDDRIAQALAMTARRQILVCGMETHVCVLQSVAGLLDGGYFPFVAADAVCSRDEDHRTGALQRMRTAGAVVTNRESALFEFLRDASHPRFRDVSRLIK